MRDKNKKDALSLLGGLSFPENVPKNKKIPKELSIDVRKFTSYTETFASDRGRMEVFYYLKLYIRNVFEIENFDTRKFLEKGNR